MIASCLHVLKWNYSWEEKFLIIHLLLYAKSVWGGVIAIRKITQNSHLNHTILGEKRKKKHAQSSFYWCAILKKNYFSQNWKNGVISFFCQTVYSCCLTALHATFDHIYSTSVVSTVCNLFRIPIENVMNITACICVCTYI